MFNLTTSATGGTGSRLSLAAALLIASAQLGVAHAADPQKGGEIYGTHCATCHGDGGTPFMPGTPDFGRGDNMFQPDSKLAISIREGKSIMPAFQGLLSDDDINDVIAYVRTLRR